MSEAPTVATTGFQLVLPPDPQLLRVVRLVASGLASLGQLDLDAVGGRGLHLVSTVADRWGTGFDDDGRTLVWAELPASRKADARGALA